MSKHKRNAKKWKCTVFDLFDCIQLQGRIVSSVEHASPYLNPSAEFYFFSLFPAINTECDKSVWIQCGSNHNAYGGQIQLKTWFLPLTVYALCLWMPVLVVCVPVFQRSQIWECECGVQKWARVFVRLEAAPDVQFALQPGLNELLDHRFTLTGSLSERDRERETQFTSDKAWWWF